MYYDLIVILLILLGGVVVYVTLLGVAALYNNLTGIRAAAPSPEPATATSAFIAAGIEPLTDAAVIADESAEPESSPVTETTSGSEAEPALPPEAETIAPLSEPETAAIHTQSPQPSISFAKNEAAKKRDDRRSAQAAAVKDKRKPRFSKHLGSLRKTPQETLDPVRLEHKKREEEFRRNMQQRDEDLLRELKLIAEERRLTKEAEETSQP